MGAQHDPCRPTTTPSPCAGTSWYPQRYGPPLSCARSIPRTC
jgi:hypothetical protein